MSEKKCIRVVAAEIERDGRFLITQRRPTATLPLLWEFPSGRVEPGERDEDALVREIREEMDIEVRVGKLSMFIKHEYDEYSIDLCVYRCELVSENIKPRKVHDWRWVGPDEMDQYEFPPADAQTIEKLLHGR
ncbi:(deoxy)nucleoside triphosphate pyrophosphohydrolase [Myxococcota bacterium]|nr:(deoxy)nucleoside triphosphate pyrophosphohydrolase [Myxococcota bacterium]